MTILKPPQKNNSMPQRIRQRAVNMAMTSPGGAAMPPAMSGAPMSRPSAMAGSPSTLKNGGIVKEKASGERYASKGAMKKHEAKEGKAMERKEDKMRGGGIAVKGKGVALRGGGIAVKGKGVALKKGGEAKRPGLMVMIAVGKGKKK